VLDKILVDAAVAAGAELRETFTVTELLRDDEGIIGIRGHARGGAPVEERARIVIGADGTHSTIARQVQAATYHDRPSFTCAYYAYWSDVPLAGAELHPRPENMIIAGPTNDAQILLIIYWPAAMFHQVRTDIEGHFMRALALVPDLHARVLAGRRTERFRGTGDLPNYYRTPAGPGWGLVGDAGYHKDPITAQGMSDAFRDAELLATAIDDGFAGRRPLEAAMLEYERQRNEATMPIYELTTQFASLAPPSEEQQLLFGALRHNQEQTNRLFGAIVGTVPIPEFFAPENLGRIIGAAPSATAATAG
jgi:flavin-dependent dehydrogenase